MTVRSTVRRRRRSASLGEHFVADFVDPRPELMETLRAGVQGDPTVPQIAHDL